tara:strand:- start:4388 stop:5203 length:816 start_codon:yes stop_codon:yes gene_type:complete
VSHISHWELSNWNTCPFYHKLMHIDKLSAFKDNEYFAFGRAVHNTCERLFEDRKHSLTSDDESAERLYPKQTPEFFEEDFLKELKEAKKTKNPLDKELVFSLREQGKKVVPLVMEATVEQFGEFEIISAEEKLFEPIHDLDFPYDFKGRLDLVLKTSDGKYHIIDWKTCSWGWDARKKSDRMTTYQLTYYKHYFAQKHNIDPEDIETYFALIKRTAKQNNVEFVRITSGEKKTENAIGFLTNALWNVKNKNYIKNKLSCGRCDFSKTKHCP